MPSQKPLGNVGSCLLPLDVNLNDGLHCRPSGLNLFTEGIDTVLAVFPFYHISGACTAAFHSMYMGVTVITFPRFEFGTFLGAIEKYKVIFTYIRCIMHYVHCCIVNSLLK